MVVRGSVEGGCRQWEAMGSGGGGLEGSGQWEEGAGSVGSVAKLESESVGGGWGRGRVGQ